ncbi:succinate dehydrogenase assembly factor 2 [Rickettsia endosymbiont of Polydrusus tereticollis]|uniref:succinate dehydrogenase assembly factor 2 n=1 Tax=Rickettsia endosymbiont of Polydrusus tereticollis TaxID=3066251 RepID=UPI003132EB6A|nr:succinate dehydrogenase assembly factor 2 [Rickettsia endosymbiont of Oxypoda opaca]
MNKLNKKDFQKKLFYRSKNRGCRETDYIFSKFAEQFLFKLDEKSLNDFALILDQNDNELYNWITGKSPIPSYLNTEIMNKLREFSKS